LSWTSLSRPLRTGFLIVILSAVYFVLIVPIAWRKRKNERKVFNARTGWHSNEQSTSDSKVCATMPSFREELTVLVRRERDTWMILLYDILTRLQAFADPPKEKELRTDLYVMF